MQRLKFTRIHTKVNQATQTIRRIFVHQLPAYIEGLPRIRKHVVRWTLQLLYYGLGFMFNWAVSAVLRQMPNMHQFPSNVAGTIVLFFLLMCSHTFLPGYTDRFVQWVSPCSTSALKSMNIMFIPAVVQIVKNSPTPGPEVGRMMCVFFVGYFVGFITTTILVRLLRLLLFGPFPEWLSKWNKNKSTSIHEKSIENAATIDIPEETHDEANSLAILPCSPNRSEHSALTENTIMSSIQDPEIHYCCHTKDILTAKKHRHGPLHTIAIWCMRESNFDDLTYLAIFCTTAFIFLPLPENNPAMPFFRLFLYFSMTILLYSAACRLPAKIRVFFHPIIVASAAVMAGIAYFERVKGFDIYHGVDLYKTGITFISLVEKTNIGWPGAGDLLSAAMDVSILSLAFNVYKSRPNQFRQWIVIFLSIVPVAFLVMLITPMFAHAIGCTPDDSITWSSRSVTTAIGMVIGNILDANQSVVMCIILFTGIMGPIFGDILLRIARVKEDDYMTIGITMGSHSHGVGTAYLILKNPKASGMASIAFAVFGTIGVIVASIPTFSDIIKSFSGF